MFVKKYSRRHVQKQIKRKLNKEHISALLLVSGSFPVFQTVICTACVQDKQHEPKSFFEDHFLYIKINILYFYKFI
jgi:hypothetical protein